MEDVIGKEEIEKLMTNVSEDWKEWFQSNNTQQLKNVEIRDDGVFLIGNPKSGTTWLQELVWLIGNDLDYERAKKFIDERFPVLEMETFIAEKPKSSHAIYLDCHTHSLSYVEGLSSPRFVKSHMKPSCLPTQLLEGEKKAKIIYISRNLKDVCMSSYYYTRDVLKIHKCSVDEYAKLFMCVNDRWESILYFWNHRNDENILFLRYEEMKANLEEVIKKVAKFLNKTLTEEQTKELVDWLHFDKMKENTAVNHNTIYESTGFIRKGKVGGYKTEMSPEVIGLFNRWTEGTLKGSDYVEFDT